MIISNLTRPRCSLAIKQASELLDIFSIDRPPVDPAEMARHLDVDVFFVKLDDEDQNISGLYDASEDAIFVNESEWALRQTFTAAHELGHKVLHDEWARSSDYTLLFRDPAANSDDPCEKEANAFATNLLAPRFMLDDVWTRHSAENLSRLVAESLPVIKHRIATEYGARHGSRQE